MILSSLIARGNDSEMSFGEITALTFEAVMEVVIICLMGFFTAKLGLLNPQNQKVISQLNIDLFTPCLVFSKLAPSLSLQKMAEIVIIPIFFVVLMVVSFLVSRLTSTLLLLNEPEGDFVTAMAVFSNSNSLPVSLTLSLAGTLPDLLWEDVDNDTSDGVASRGILYLLIMQQMGQVVRWSWGYNTLLRKRSWEELNSYPQDGIQLYETAELLHEPSHKPDAVTTSAELNLTSEHDRTSGSRSSEAHLEVAPETGAGKVFAAEPRVSENGQISPVAANEIATNGNATNGNETNGRLSNVSLGNGSASNGDDEVNVTEDSQKTDLTTSLNGFWKKITHSNSVQKVLAFMNPPLWSMVISVIVASVPFLQKELFGTSDTFLHNTITKSITQLGLVSIPLILIVLGSNLYPAQDLPQPSRHFSRVVVASIMSRMIIPPLVILPLVSLLVKFVKISILDDPIFLIVAFLLTVSPPAIQLSQITQINNIYQREMASVLFWGYVVLTLPTTILIVVTSLEVLEWAK